MREILMVAVGGSLGALGRYGLNLVATRCFGSFPYGTTTANLMGCFLIGMFIPLTDAFPPWARHLTVIGFLGALTTLSSLALEVNLLLEARRYEAAMLQWGLSAVGGMCICAVGWWLSARYFQMGS